MINYDYSWDGEMVIVEETVKVMARETVLVIGDGDDPYQNGFFIPFFFLPRPLT